MAREDKNILNTDDRQRAKEIAEKDKHEKEEIEKLRKEKEKKRRLKEKKANSEQKVEIKRIKSLVKLPFRLLLQVSSLLTLISMIVLIFLIELDVTTSLVYMFFIFTSVYLGLGSIMIGVFYMLGEDKKREMIEAKRLVVEQSLIEEQKRINEQEAKLAEIEKDIRERKSDTTKAKELLPETSKYRGTGYDSDANDLSDEIPLPLMLEDSAASLDEQFGNKTFEPDLEDYISTEMASMPLDDDIPAEDKDYFDEILSPDFKP